MLQSIIVLLFMLTLLSRCCDGFLSSYARRFLQESNNTSETTTDLPAGIYTSRGYGYAVQVDENGIVTVYDETSLSCIDNTEDVAPALKDFELNGTVVMVSDGVTDYYFDKVDVFSGACADGVSIVQGDDGYEYNAVENFNVLQTTFSEQYAFFEERNIDWDELTADTRANLVPESNSTELMAAFVSVLDPLEDGHVQVLAIEGGEIIDFYSSKPLEIVTRLQTEFTQQSEFDDFEEFQNSLLFGWLQTIGGYMEDGLSGDIDSFLWGKFTDINVGYIMMQGMSTEDEDSFMEELTDVFSTLKTTDSLVFDIRVNGGGEDSISLLIASYFAKERTKAFSKKAWDPSSSTGFSPETEIYVEPTTNTELRYDGDVILIVSGSTVSAAEIFTITMAQIPKVTVFGRPTSGEFSDILTKQLPNGWRFGLTNEVYATPDGVVHEIEGFPPETSAQNELLPLMELQNGLDTWLDEALMLAKSSVPSASPTRAPTPTPLPTESPLSEAPTQGNPGTQAPVPSPTSASFALVPAGFMFFSMLSIPTFADLLW